MRGKRLCLRVTGGEGGGRSCLAETKGEGMNGAAHTQRRFSLSTTFPPFREIGACFESHAAVRALKEVLKMPVNGTYG